MQLTLSLGAPPPPELDNFVSGTNGALIEHLRQIKNGDKSERMIYWWGAHGVGKTHLLEAMRGHALIWDDCDSMGEAAQRSAFIAFTEALVESNKVLLLAGNVPPAQLRLREDLRTRIEQCLIFEIKPLSDEDIRLALALTIAQRGVVADPDLINLFLNRLPRSMGSLRHAVDALDQLSLERKKPFSLTLARELLGNTSYLAQSSADVSSDVTGNIRT